MESPGGTKQNYSTWWKAEFSDVEHLVSGMQYSSK
jgi:hypothetical protein